jgi:NodT family efflux transporter outer membrane factor (OMF) lipoprotein
MNCCNVDEKGSHNISPGTHLLACVAVILACLSGCSSLGGPEYERPTVVEKPNWSELEGRQVATTDVVRMDWWTAFGDSYLNQLIDTALQQGLDLKIASLRLEKAGITLQQQRFPLTPTITGGPVAAYQRGKQEGSDIISQSSAEAINLNLNWELDIWGKVKKGALAAEATYKSTEMDWRAAYLTLVTAVSELYFQIRQFDEQIAQQQASVDQKRELLGIWQQQYDEGMVPQTKILNQQSEISTGIQQLMELQRSRDEAEFKLATLTGTAAGDLTVPPGFLRNSIKLIPEPEVMPGDLLARRPDVLRAEYNLLAAHNLVGQARLARLPSLGLRASAGSGDGISPLISRWSYAFLLDWTSFLDRDKKIQVTLSEAEVKILTEDYRRAVLTAYEEVEIALLNLNVRRAQLTELENQTAVLEIVYKVQKAQLREGLVSQLEIFDTERTLLEAQQQVLSNYRSLLTDTLVLYKAVGGGWPVETVANTR